MVRCSDCGLVFTNPRPAINALGSVYPAEYSPHQRHHRKKITRRWRLHQWALRCHWNYPPIVANPAARLASWPVLCWVKAKARNYDLFCYRGAGRLLDYGCANGKYLMRMQARGWDVTGMDMSERAVETCKQMNINACVGAAPAEQFGPDSFDVVTLWDVLEHVPSPTETLRQIHSILSPDGRLVFGVPNGDSLPARWFGERWFAYDLPRHLTHFSKTTAAALLKKTGFAVEKIVAKRYGQTVLPSLKYVAAESESSMPGLLARSKRLCYAIEHLATLFSEPSEMVVHARKL